MATPLEDGACQNHKFQPRMAEGACQCIALTRTSTLRIPVQSNNSGWRRNQQSLKDPVPGGSTGGPQSWHVAEVPMLEGGL